MRGFRPAIDMIESETELILVVELAGVKSEDIQIQLVEQTLTIRGYRHRPKIQNANFHQLEIHYGNFRFDLHLPRVVDSAAVDANMDNGLLTVSMPVAQPKKIEIIKK
ncbi:hypothetical protein MASR2M15_24570 [Anaerolineales bacterium]